MDPRVAKIDWSRSGAAKLPPTLRTSLADLWRESMRAEHRSAGIFSTFVLDLMAAGAPARFLSVAAAAAVDELRHAELCAQLTTCYSGRAERPEPGIPRVPDDSRFTAREQALHQALFLSVAAETFSSIMLADVHRHARDPVVREVMRIVLADEVQHARLGWSYLAWALDDPEQAETTRAFVREHLLGVFDIAHRSLFGDPAEIPPASLRGRDAELATAHGYRPARGTYALFHESIPAVWIPAFAQLGIDASALATRFARPRWLQRVRREMRTRNDT